VHPEANLGAGVIVEAGAVILAGVRIGDGCVLGENSVLGKTPRLGAASTAAPDGPLPDLLIGKNCKIGCGAVLCAGSKLGDNCLVGDGALVRENVLVGDNAVIGAHVVVENKVKIGARTKIQTNAYITALTEIDEDVFIAPCVITTNDNYMGRTEERFMYKGGPKIRRGARVGAGAILLPNVTIGAEAFIAAGSIVTKDVRPGVLFMGAPAKELREVPDKEKLDNP